MLRSVLSRPMRCTAQHYPRRRPQQLLLDEDFISAEMEDGAVTNMLKREVINKASVQLENGKVEMAGKLYSKDAATRYVSKRNIPYTLGSIALLYSMKEEDYGEYLKQCKENEVSPVSYIDRERILADLLVPPMDETAKVAIPSRLGSLTGAELMRRYQARKKSAPGIQYLVVPKSKELGAELVRAVLLAHPETKGLDNGSIRYRQCRYKLIDEPVPASELESIAAVFVDGSTWQFGMWPKEMAETMRTRPVVYLFQDAVRPALPKLSASVIVLRVAASDPASLQHVATAFWSILGHAPTAA